MSLNRCGEFSVIYHTVNSNSQHPFALNPGFAILSCFVTLILGMFMLQICLLKSIEQNLIAPGSHHGRQTSLDQFGLLGTGFSLSTELQDLSFPHQRMMKMLIQPLLTFKLASSLTLRTKKILILQQRTKTDRNEYYKP